MMSSFQIVGQDNKIPVSAPKKKYNADYSFVYFKYQIARKQLRSIKGIACRSAKYHRFIL